MNKTIVAVDIGASSGRLIAGTFVENKMKINEVHRFKNSITQKDGNYFWDIDGLFNEIITGLKKCKDKFRSIESVGIDTWAVDYVLLDDTGKRTAPVFAYRDHRTDGTMDKVFARMSSDNIYKKTGIQFLQFNTIYQLFEHKLQRKEELENANNFLMIPDYLNYLLCGKKAVEFSNATSTQLVNINDRNWDKDLLEVIEVSSDIFPDIVQPGTVMGEILPEICNQTGLSNVKIIAPATHDTGSAIAAVPALSDNFAYISSGTWSLMGIESKEPITSETAMKYNFTNEGGVFGTYRVLKNIMGLWIFQEVKRLLKEDLSFAQLTDLAKESQAFKCLINPNDKRFLNPENMIEEIKSFCRETNQDIPNTPGELSRCVFESLAFGYKQTLQEIRELNDKQYNKIHIIGGGAKNKLLNQLCADFTRCDVYAGPFEATAIGNLTMQLIALGEIESLEKARRVISSSFNVEVFKPKERMGAKENWEKFKEFTR